MGEVWHAVSQHGVGVFQGQGKGMFLFCRRELALATSYTTSVDVTDILSTAAGRSQQGNRRECDDHDDGSRTSCAP